MVIVDPQQDLLPRMHQGHHRLILHRVPATAKGRERASVEAHSPDGGLNAARRRVAGSGTLIVLVTMINGKAGMATTTPAVPWTLTANPQMRDHSIEPAMNGHMIEMNDPDKMVPKAPLGKQTRPPSSALPLSLPRQLLRDQSPRFLKSSMLHLKRRKRRKRTAEMNHPQELLHNQQHFLTENHLAALRWHQGCAKSLRRCSDQSHGLRCRQIWLHQSLSTSASPAMNLLLDPARTARFSRPSMSTPRCR